MFRIVLTDADGNETLHQGSYQTEASAEEEAIACMRQLNSPLAQILRPIAELAPVTTIQRRPINPRVGDES